jgi:hypothetical protein
VVAVKGKGLTRIGADSAGLAGWSLTQRVDPKIYSVGTVVFGYTTSFRMGQILGHMFSQPDHHPDVPMERYMVGPFVDAIRACLKTGGYAKKENEVESGGEFLVLYRSRIFRISNDYQVGESLFPFDAVGSGAEIALGALHAIKDHDLGPAEKLTAALEASEALCGSVRRPFIFAEHKWDSK